MSITIRENTRRKLFGKSSLFLRLAEDLMSNASTHSYSFIDDSIYKAWIESEYFDIAENNRIIALELIDKAHLAALTSIVRTMRWANAACLMYEASNFLAWASSSRSLLESAGDILDGLLNISITLATNHRAISSCLSGTMDIPHNFKSLEDTLDHFVLAKWGRNKGNILTAKNNAEYVRNLEPVIPDVVKLYQRLCSITHPSADSINFLFDQDREGNEKLRLKLDNDIKFIQELLDEFPNALATAVMMSSTSPMLVLKVLHKFRIHPKLPIMKKLTWEKIPAWPRIEKALKS